MITVTETVYVPGQKEPTVSKKEWPLKNRFLNQLRKYPGISSFTIATLHRTNEAEFEIDGIKRKIEIQPHIDLSPKDDANEVA